MPAPPLLLLALTTPGELTSFSSADWTRLFRLARSAKLHARLAHLTRETGVFDQLPPRVQDHLTAAAALAAKHERMVRWEVNRIGRALMHVDAPVVLLKGAAYVMAGLPPARGRFVSDVDILVPKNSLSAVEVSLHAAGWKPMKLHGYDDRYYRQWMHELPPMRHAARKSILDVHHTILPESGRLHPDPRLLLSAACGVAANSASPPHHLPRPFLTLAPTDMLLHSAAHLFQDGDLAGSVRDLIDLDDLLRHFTDTVPCFLEKLVPRAKELDLHRPLFYALRFTHKMLGTPVPTNVLQAAAQAGRPIWPVTPLMDMLAGRALLPDTGDERRLGAAASRFLLYIRSHWLRMPPMLLASHLTKKAMRRWSKDEEKPSDNPEPGDVQAK